MPNLIFYREEDRRVPVLEWFESLPQKARLACIARIELLKARGRELRRPHADYLRDDIYELRAKHQGVNYRLLYFFHGQSAVVLAHGVLKQRATVPPIDTERARRRKQAFDAHPERHTHEET